MPETIQSRRSRRAKMAAASAPSATTRTAAVGRWRAATIAATASAPAHEENITRLPPPATSAIHSHNTAMPAKPQNSVKA